MKIAIFSDCYLDLIGGIVQVINTQKAELERQGHTVYVFSTGFPRPKKQLQTLAKSHIFKIPSCRLFFRGLTPVSRRPPIIENWLLQNFPELKNFDIFYIHYEAGCSIAALHLAQKLSIPTVQVMHGREDMGESNIIPRGFRTIVAYVLNHLHARYLPHPIKITPDDYLATSRAKAKMWELMVNHANAADAVITPSRHFQQKLQHYGVSQKIHVIPNGFPDEKFLPNPTAKTLSPNKPLKIIWHSRVSAEKRIMPFLRALNLTPGRWQLDVYGGGGDYFRAQRYARRHRLNVKFHGNAKFTTVQKAIQTADLDVLASYNFDTFGMTLIEAEAAGVPVFICDPDLTEVVPEGGYVLAPGPSSTEMSAALQGLLAHPEKIHQMSTTMLAHRSEILTSHRLHPLLRLFQTLKQKPTR